MARDPESRFTQGKYKGVPRCQRATYPTGAPWRQDYQCDKVARPQDKDEDGVVSCSFHLKVDARAAARLQKFNSEWTARTTRSQEAMSDAKDLTARLGVDVAPFYVHNPRGYGVYDPSRMVVTTEFLEKVASAHAEDVEVSDPS